LRPRREKVFGRPQGVPLDRNAKARIKFSARAYNTRTKQPGQHKGPLTRAYLEVLDALLWGFHNSTSGLCFPSYEAIAAKAGCCRDTVYEAIKALELAGIMTWVNRLTRIEESERDMFGQWARRWRVIRTSNAYLFRDPLPCAPNGNSSKSENPPRTLNQDLPLDLRPSSPPKTDADPPDEGVIRALINLGRSMGIITEGATA
jgi:hypothetical protein